MYSLLFTVIIYIITNNKKLDNRGELQAHILNSRRIPNSSFLSPLLDFPAKYGMIYIIGTALCRLDPRPPN